MNGMMRLVTLNTWRMRGDWAVRRTGITTASKRPFGRVFEIDLHVTGRTHDFAGTRQSREVRL
jgi:hypothetical protein